MNKALRFFTGKIDVNRDLILLLLVGGLYSLSIALSNTFVNVYLWKQSGQYRDIALYNLAIVIMQPLTFILAGRWAKSMDRVIVLRVGVTCLSAFYLMVLMVGENASSYLLTLGGLLGIGYGFYWLAYNVLTFEITEPDTRDFFNGFLGLLTSFAGMIGPFLAGYIISSLEKFTGYTVIFSISLGLFIGAVILSFFLERRPAKGNFSFRRILFERKNDENWNNILKAHFVQGLREGTFLFVISVWVFVTTNSELALGTFGLINSGVAFVFYFLATRFIKPRHRKKAILIGGIMLYAAVFLVTFQLSFTRLIIYAIVIAIAYPILLVPYLSLTFDVIGRAWRAAEMRIEYIVVRELYLNLGRITSILSFIFAITFFNEKIAIPVVLIIIGIGHLLISVFVRHIHFGEKEEKELINGRKFIKKELADEEGGSTV
ncbi:MFS transporter [Bacillus solimangrovi]|uniref:Major facilitator superfamily (MFS) profile domain-containing protein n=1 Tax=Bacillus solimangrovi TaxID=1305675 RepID=A0A1E5LFR4_9BACI|nr:MFS transporter [Bacillus solimangrovi]OEH92919.1 hypothetical protein BFG57_14695 [Bacillus solimangrovi]